MNNLDRVDLVSFVDSLNSNPGLSPQNSQKRYISISADGRYCSLGNIKSSKNLNTAAINALFQKASVEFRDDARKLEKLNSGIERFKTRLENRSRPWYYYVFCRFFGRRSAEENELIRIKGVVETALAPRQRAPGYVPPPVPQMEKISVAPANTEVIGDSEIQRGKELVDQQLKGASRVPVTLMKLFDSLKSGWDSLGTSQELGLKSYIDDLHAFIGSEMFASLSAVQQDRIGRTLHELEFAFEITILRTLYEKEENPERKQVILKTINSKIQTEISKLQLNDCVLIPGGYLNPNNLGHAALYMIKKSDRTHVSFTNINTGEGSRSAGRLSLRDLNGNLNVFKAVKGIKTYIAEGFKQLRSIVKKSHSHPRDRKVVDITYSNVSTNALNNEFFSFLITSHKRKEQTDMKTVNGEIGRRLGAAQMIEGRKHNGQNNGACSTKSVASFIHERLGEVNVYRTFKLFSSEIEQANLGQVEDIDNLKSAATYIVAKRTKKADKEAKVNKEAASKARKDHERSEKAALKEKKRASKKKNT